MTSDGVLYESLEGADKERLDYNTYITGAGRLCEVEGLAANIEPLFGFLNRESCFALSANGLDVTLYQADQPLDSRGCD